jgi:hypothetical protein
LPVRRLAFLACSIVVFRKKSHEAAFDRTVKGNALMHSKINAHEKTADGAKSVKKKRTECLSTSSWRRTHDKLENIQVKEVRKAKAPQPTAMIFFRGMIIFFEFFDTLFFGKPDFFFSIFFVVSIGASAHE